MTNKKAIQINLDRIKQLAKHQSDDTCAMCCSSKCTQCAILFDFPYVAQYCENIHTKNIDLEARLAIAVEALEKIADQDWRGNRPWEMVLAKETLEAISPPTK